MTRQQVKDKGQMNPTTAPLINVSLCHAAMGRAMERPDHLPGLVCFYGFSGWGKSSAAAYTNLRYDAYYVQCQSSWKGKALLLAILDDMGIVPAKTIPEMADQVCEQLANSGRPLILDEFDHVVDKGFVEIVRDIYEGSGAAIMLIGEEKLPSKLEKWERFHGRVLDWVQAQPADLEDARHLANLYCREVQIADDLLAAINNASAGSARRICVNLERVRDEALGMGATAMTSADWGGREFYTGRAPVRRGR